MACTLLGLLHIAVQWWRSLYLDFPWEIKELDAEEAVKSGTPQTWPRSLPESLPDSRESDSRTACLTCAVEGEVMGKGWGESLTRCRGIPESKTPEEDATRKVSPEKAPEVTSVRRRSSVGIQRQASVCLSDGDDQEVLEHPGEESAAQGSAASLSSGSIAESEQVMTGGRPRPEVTQVAVVVHRSNDRSSVHSWDLMSVCSSGSQPTRSSRPPLYTRSHSSPDSGSAVRETRTGARPSSSTSLRGAGRIDPLRELGAVARMVDLEDYHYSQRQVWVLASQGASLLQERSQSSLDVAAASEGWLEVPTHLRQAGSTEAGLLEQSLELHQRENLRSLLRRRSPVDEEDDVPLSKVRYNDTGSREEIHDDVLEAISGESDEDEDDGEKRILDTGESEFLRQQYRKLWELRATLEEEEGELSDTLRMEDEEFEEDDEDATSQGRYEEQEQTTSFESNADPAAGDEGDDPPDDCDCAASNEFLQLPSQESRRRNYKNLLTRRLQRITPDSRQTTGSTENSFDSFESSSTDRTEGVTTSFESTTDNTDSTGEGQTHRLQQMKADSGYKSMESNGKPPRLSRRQLRFAVDGDSLDVTLEGSLEEEEEVEGKEGTSEQLQKPSTSEERRSSEPEHTDIGSKEVKDVKPKLLEDEGLGVEELAPETELEKRSKSALRRRRHADKQSVGDVTQWTEVRTLSEGYSEMRGKTSVFQRFFRSGRTRYDKLLSRDYSIDEKSDALFREFSRPDLAYETDYYRSRVSRHYGHIRLHHHHRSYDQEGGSPHLARKVLSPQLSIEEESCESDDEQQQSATDETRSSQGVGERSRSPHVTLAHIPVIQLPVDRGERLT